MLHSEEIAKETEKERSDRGQDWMSIFKITYTKMRERQRGRKRDRGWERGKGRKRERVKQRRGRERF